MLNLILKDFQLAKRNLVRVGLIMAVVLTALIAAKDFNSSFVYYFIFLFTTNFVMTLFSTEEKEHCLSFIRTLPITTRELVGSRFATIAIVILGLSLISVGLQCISGLVMANTLPSADQMVFHFGLSLIFLSLFSGIILPLMYKLGYTRAAETMRVLFFAIILVPIAIIYMINNFSTEVNGLVNIGAIGDFLNTIPLYAWGGFLSCLAVSVLAISYKICCGYFDRFTVHLS